MPTQPLTLTGAQHRSMSRMIMRLYRQATPEQLKSGQRWYGDVLDHCEALAEGNEFRVDQIACALAHLSPRITWAKNLEVLTAVTRNRDSKPAWAMTRSWERAVLALESEAPMTTFGPNALKTRTFAKAILGDGSAVVVDVWAARAAGAPERVVTTIGGYNAVADAYRRASKRAGVSARDLQAITWCVIRGREN